MHLVSRPSNLKIDRYTVRSLDADLALAKETASAVLDGLLTIEAGTRFVGLLDHEQSREVLRGAIAGARGRAHRALLGGR